MAKKIYLSKIKKDRVFQKFFDKGLTIASCILVSLKEGGEDFLKSLPSSYPGFKLLKDTFGIENFPRQVNKSTFKTNLYRLRKDGLIIKDPKTKIYYLTEQGQKIAAEIEDRYSISKKWDGKLRIVVFDIPETKKGWREAIRRELSFLGFCQLQKSVYIGKYPLSETFYKELIEKNIAKYLFLLTIGEIDRKEEVLAMIEKKLKEG